MKRLVLASMALVLAGAWSGVRSGERPIVAVFPIHDLTGKLDRALLESLTEYLSAEVAAGGNFSIQAPGDMKRLLTERAKESYRECFEEKCQIELGRELAANKMISAKIIQLGDSCTVSLALYDLRTQATDMTVTHDAGCSPQALKRSLNALAARIKTWGSQRRPSQDTFREGQIGERVKRLDVQQGEEVIVVFGSMPEGAVVIVDGVLVCEKTPCSRKFPAGTHLVSMQKKSHLGRSEQVILARGTELAWELEPTFGLLNVSSQPAGQQVVINGEAVGTTPLSRHPLDPGIYEVLVASPCFYDQGERVQILAREERNIDVTLVAKVGGLQVDARDPAGNDVEAELFIDGQPLGAAPGRFEVSVCARKLIARTSRGAAEVDLEVSEGEWRKLDLTLLPATAKAGPPAPGGQPGQPEQDSGLRIDFLLAPTVGYSGLMNLSAQAADESSLSADVKGPSVGARLDMFFGKLLGLVARYDYLFLNNSGLGSLALAISYSSLWGTIEKKSFELIPSVSMYLGAALIHAPRTAFGDASQQAAEDFLKAGLLLSMDLSLDFVIGELFMVGVAGEVGYLFTSLGDSDSGSACYWFGATARVGLRF